MYLCMCIRYSYSVSYTVYVHGTPLYAYVALYIPYTPIQVLCINMHVCDSLYNVHTRDVLLFPCSLIPVRQRSNENHHHLHDWAYIGIVHLGILVFTVPINVNLPLLFICRQPLDAIVTYVEREQFRNLDRSFETDRTTFKFYVYEKMSKSTNTFLLILSWCYLNTFKHS